MAKMPPVVMEMLNANPVLPKVLTTCDAEGNLNTVPKETLYAIDPETIVFADFWGYKTNENLIYPPSASSRWIRYLFSVLPSRACRLYRNTAVFASLQYIQ